MKRRGSRSAFFVLFGRFLGQAQGMTIPNAITCLRLCLVPLIVVLIHERRFDLAFYTFTVAGLTDAVDGFIARHWNQKSEIGAYLDALADKSLIGATVIALASIGTIPFWLMVLVIFRDLTIVGAVAIAWLMHNPVPIEPIMISKVNTAAQIAMVSTILANGAFGLSWTGTIGALHGLVALLTVASVSAYFVKWFRHMAELAAIAQHLRDENDDLATPDRLLDGLPRGLHRVSLPVLGGADALRGGADPRLSA